MALKMNRMRCGAAMAAVGALLAFSSTYASAEEGRAKGQRNPATKEAPADKGSREIPRATPGDRAKTKPAPESEGCPFDGERKLELIV